jgi:glycosyltransferase involved in cell wall biosynthesis
MHILLKHECVCLVGKSNKQLNTKMLRVCYFGTYRSEYSRNRILIKGLRRAGVEVIECHSKLWFGIEDRVRAASGGWISPRFLLRVIQAYFTLLRKYWRMDDFDVMVVGYPGQFDVYLARILTWLRRKPLVWDVLMSIYLVSIERRLDQRSPVTVWALKYIERIACRLPNLLIIEGSEYRDWFYNTHNVPSDRFRLVPLGADDDVYHPLDDNKTSKDCFTVFYHGSFVRSHGIPTILKAADLLRMDPGIEFVFAGTGPEENQAVSLVKKWGLKNVSFLGFVDRGELLRLISHADICLGVFGDTAQSMITIQNKIFEAMAMGKAIVTSDTSALRALMIHGKHIYLCERGNPQSLVDAICELKSDKSKCQLLGENAYRLFRERFSTQSIGRIFAKHLQELVGQDSG